MSGIVTKWSPENVATLISCLRRNVNETTAISEASLLLGFEVTFPAASKVINRACKMRLSQLLGQDIKSSPPKLEPSTRPIEDLDPESLAELAAFRSTQVARASQLPPAFVKTEPKPEPKKERTSDDDLAERRMKMRISELEEAKKRLLKDLDDHKDQIAAMRDLRAANPLGPVTAAKKVGGKQRTGTPVMLCSDWHVEEPVDPKTINGINEYNLAIAAQCIDALADGYEWMLRDARYDCRTGVVALLGDLFSGYIHEELIEGNFLSPTQAVLWLQEHIEKMLRKIAANCPNLERIIVPCTDGNHGRNTHKIRVSTRTANSLEWLMYQNLAVRMSDDPRFEFQIADGEWTFVDLYGDTIGFTHGDSFQYGGGVGGISIPIRRGVARQFQGMDIAKVCMGHFHQLQDFGDIAVNGSLIGYNAYAQRIHVSSKEKRQQLWFLWDSEKGQALSARMWLPETGDRTPPRT
jgi:hypothetical protein